MSLFADQIVRWQAQYGRHHLPWQTGLGAESDRLDPYPIWLSEIMLQQTQVSTVIPYFERFIQRFPDVRSLAVAAQDEVLALWAGLGYYARARNLHRCAQTVVRDFEGVFPTRAAVLMQLPGIGRSTAAAIAAFSVGERAAILDGNVRRVLCRHFGVVGFPGDKAVLDQLWNLAESLLPSADQIRPYTQGLMDLGALVCTRGKPLCAQCPVANHCVAKRNHQQSALPTPRPRKILPQREGAFLLLRQGDAWLLERRPQTGLWAGMLGLPCVAEHHLESKEDESLITDWLALRGLRLIDQIQCQTSLSHTFTHFQLHMQPWFCVVEGYPSSLETLPTQQIEKAALPTPVKKLLQRSAEAGD